MLDVQNLSKTIDKKTVLSDLTFQVDKGESLIILGRNGSGKTLLLNILATLIKPTSGKVSISGFDVSSNLKQVRSYIGFIPESYDGYSELSVLDFLTFFASAYKIERNARSSTLESVMELMDIQQQRDSTVGSLSNGERQRLLFAKTFLHEPQLWLIDEPLSVLDPHGQIEMVELLNELKLMGKTLVIATNRLEDVSKLCQIDTDDLSNRDKLGILSYGEFGVFNTFKQLEQEIKDKSNILELEPNWLAELYLEVTRP